ncbi:hypothetical protein SAMN05216494_0079 [Streptococcus sp. NLAE-zl-C503]|jgi:hypothetical protein|nr:hypothetical protein SAMN05216494_0079 [Streptococcus sp. NLAE-zl-C503]
MKKYLRRIPMNLLVFPIALPFIPFIIGYLIGSR